jgi:hypothetical protein
VAWRRAAARRGHHIMHAVHRATCNGLKCPELQYYSNMSALPPHGGAESLYYALKVKKPDDGPHPRERHSVKLCGR